eukprot:COSAG05_NODE_2493_length_2990_cov_1.086129_3_plen_110_part_00
MRAGKTYADAFGAVGGAADEGEHWADFGAVLDAEQDTLQPTHINGMLRCLSNVPQQPRRDVNCQLWTMCRPKRRGFQDLNAPRSYRYCGAYLRLELPHQRGLQVQHARA